MIHLDFESRSEVDIFKCGAWVYAAHHTTEVLCLAFAFDDCAPHLVTYDQLQEGRYLGFDVCPDLEELIERLKGGELITAHNALFEQCIWHHHMVKKYGMPEIPIEQWRCSAAKAATHALPRSLKNVGAALNTATRKSDYGHRIMMKMCKPRTPSKNNPSKWFDDPEDFEKLYEYCANDVEAEMAVDNELDDLIPQEQKLWFLDQKINLRGVNIDLDAVDAALELVEKYTKEQIEVIKKISNGYLDGVSRRLRVMQWVEAQGISMTGYTKEEIQEVLSRDNIPDKVRQILTLRLQLGKTSIKKYTAMKQAASDDGRIRDTLMYHGASTGRWSGKLVQMHNIPRGTIKDTGMCIEIMKQRDLASFEMLYPDVMEAISSCIRGMITAREEHSLYVADYSAIEARVLLWLADDKPGLLKFYKGEDLYVEMSKIIYAKEKISKKERQLGKAAILGCGYGMGAAKFQATCASWGIEIGQEMSQRVVNAYRATYSTVQSMWYAQERCAITAVKERTTVPCGKVKWIYTEDFLFCELPSGRRIAYRKPVLQNLKTPWGEMKEALHFMGTNSQTNQWVQQNTYGGKLVENITQAVARDILAESMLRAECWKYPVILSVHDEIICEVPDENKPETKYRCLKDFLQCLTVKPKWAGTCPIAADGWVGKRYKK